MLSPPCRAARMRGHTLSEVMVASAIGLLVLSGVVHLYAELARESQRMRAEARLHQALSAAGALVTGELRRAGYWSRARDTLDGGAVNGYAPVHVVDGHCVLYSYDREKNSPDGRPREDDQFGLRLAGGALQLKTSDAGCGASTCASCDGGVWWAMTDPQTVTVTELSFREESRTLPLADGAAVSVRDIHVVLGGQLRRDPSIRHTVTALVNVRNDEIR